MVLKKPRAALQLFLLCWLVSTTPALAANTRIFSTVDLENNPPGENPIFWHGGSLPKGSWAWVQIETYQTNGLAEAFVPVQVRIFDPGFKLLEFHSVRTGSDGTTLVRVQAAPKDAAGMWTAMANRNGQGTAITFPVRE